MKKSIIFAMLLMFWGCASAYQDPQYQVVLVHPSQIGGYEAVRMHYPDGRWVIYTTGQTRLVLDWEIEQMREGTTFDEFY